jgi:PAS domain S-box-containing protein
MAKIYMLSQRVPLSAVLSISSELVMQLDSSLRIIFANEPFLKLVGTDSKNLRGKNIEYTPVALVFNEAFTGFIENIRQGIAGKEWSGEIALSTKDIILFCRIAPTVFEDGRKGVSVILEDITRRKLADDALRESEDRYRKLVEISPDAVLLHRDGKIIYANSATLKLLGASHSDEIIGKNVLDFIHPDFRDAVMKNIEKDLGGDITPPIELLMLRVDRASVFVEGRGVITNIDGKTAVLVALRDITESKRAEEALRENEEKYRTLVDRANDVICVIQDGIVKICNPRLTEFWGGSVEEIVGRPFTDFIHPDALSEVIDRYNRRMTGENPPPIYQTILKRKDSSIFHAELNAGIISYNGKPADLVIIRDINERKKIETALRESEEKYRTLINRANDVISIVQDGIIKMCNPRLAEFWGGSIEEVLGKPFTDFVHPDALPEVIDRYNRRMAGESPASLYETIFMRKDGSKSYVELNAGIISYEGKTADLVIVRDINERKKVTDALSESEEKYRTVVDRANDVICIIQDGIIKMCNHPLTEFGGRSLEDIIGRDVSEFIHPDALSEALDRYNRRMAGEKVPPVYETQLKRKDGSIFYAEMDASLIVYEGNAADLVIVRDINERKKAETALRDSEEKYRTLVTATGDIVWETDAQAHFVYVSPQVESIIGYKPDELIGHAPFEFLKTDAIEPNQKMFRSAIEKREKSIIYISHWIHKDGHGVYLESHAVPIYRSDGSFSGFIGIDRKKTL